MIYALVSMGDARAIVAVEEVAPDPVKMAAKVVELARLHRREEVGVGAIANASYRRGNSLIEDQCNLSKTFWRSKDDEETSPTKGIQVTQNPKTKPL